MNRSRTVKRQRAKFRTPPSSTWSAAIAVLDSRAVYGEPSRNARVGSSNPRAKLDDDEVRRLRCLYADAIGLGVKHPQACRGLASCFGLHPRSVVKIVRKERRAS